MSESSVAEQVRQAGPSPLTAVPSPETIRDRMTRNAEENRLLKSLYRLARRIAERERQGVADAR